MKRKVIQLAGTTYVVSLPLKWVRAQNIQKGQEVDINPQGNIVTLTVGQLTPPIETKIITLSYKHPPRYIKSVINNLFRRGITELTINFDDKKIVPQIQEALQEAIGYELISQKEKYCIVKNIAGIHGEEFDNLLRRLFLLVLTLGEESHTSLQQKELPDLESIERTKKTIEKILNSCCQILASEQRNKSTTVFTYLIAYTLEKIANEFVYALTETKKMPETKVVEFYGDAVLFLRSFYEAYYARNANTVSSLATTKDHLLEKGEALIRKVPSNQVSLLHHLLSVVRRTYEMSGPYLGEVL